MVKRSSSIWENMDVQPNNTPVAMGVWSLECGKRRREGREEMSDDAI